VAKHLPQGGKTRTIKWQNSCHKAAKTYNKRWQTRGKSLYCMLKKNFPAHQNVCTPHQKKSFVLQKKAFVLQK